jgi:hypothetical protein
MVVCIDEVQELLDRVDEDGQRDLAGMMRHLIDQDDGVRFLISGSCSFANVKSRLQRSGAPLAAEIEERDISFLSRQETDTLVRRGFEEFCDPPVFLMPSGSEAFWQLTAGYPDHVHRLAKQVAANLETEQSLVVDASGVRSAAGHLVSRGRDVVEHLIGSAREQEYLESVLLAISDLLPGEDEPPIGLDALAEQAGAGNLAGINRFLRLGLLRRRRDGTLDLTNGMVRMWLRENAQSVITRRRDSLGDPSLRLLRVEGFETLDAGADGLGEWARLRRDGQHYRARRRPGLTDAEKDVLLATAAERFDAPVGDIVDPAVVGDWIILDDLLAPSMADYMRDVGQDGILEPVDVAHIVAMVHGALNALVSAQWHHGNLTPDRIRSRPGGGCFVADWAFGSGGTRNPLTAIDLLLGPLRHPETVQRFQRAQRFQGGDDIFTLGALLFRALHREGRDAYPLALDCADLSGDRPDYAGMYGDPSLRRIVISMIEDSQRLEPGMVLAMLRGWLAGRQPR